MQRKEDKSVQRNVDWKAYFKKISNVCPWSLEAYDNGEIQFFEDDLAIRDLGNNKANIYIFTEGYSDDDLYEITEELNNMYVEYEFLWSHPEYTKGGNRATPVPVIIQQDKAHLEYLRGNK